MRTLIQPSSIRAVRRQFLRARDSFDAHAGVFETVGDRMQQRLELLAINPTRVLDLGCRSGYQLEALQQRYPEAQIVGLDPAPGLPASVSRWWPEWLGRRPPAPVRLAADPHHLPFADGIFDLVVSNLMLPWCHAPHRVFSEVERILSSGGAFMFTSAGPDTLIEYRALWARIDSHLHSFGLIDMHDLGDAMLGAGFAAPVLDRDNLIVDYPSVAALEEELRHLGAGNLAIGRRYGLMAPGVRRAVQSSASPDERFTVTLELVQGHGWKGALHSSCHQSRDEYSVSTDSLKGSWKR